MPGTTAPSSEGTFNTCYLDSGTWYDIDMSTQSALLTSTVGTLTSVTASPTSLVAYSTTSYTFTIIPARDIPSGGKLLITLPSEISIPNPTFAANSWAARRNLREKTRSLASVGLDSSFFWSCTSSTIQINEGFSTSSFSAGGTIQFDISGVRNPVSLQQSSSFSAITQTSGSYAIDQLTTGITVTMTSTSELQLVSLSSTSLINGASNNLSFNISSPSDLVDGDKVRVIFPSQVTLPTTVSWVGITNLAASLTCSKTSQTIDITLEFSASTILAAGNVFRLRIDSITNPTSTRPTDNLSVSMRNTNGEFIMLIPFRFFVECIHTRLETDNNSGSSDHDCFVDSDNSWCKFNWWCYLHNLFGTWRPSKRNDCNCLPLRSWD